MSENLGGHKEILESFESEFCRIGLTRKQAKEYCSSLQKTRILQTATHSTATEGPTFLALHYLALMGLPPRETYFVGAYSGVSFCVMKRSKKRHFSETSPRRNGNFLREIHTHTILRKLIVIVIRIRSWGFKDASHRSCLRYC